MASQQVNARLTPELDAEFSRWADELGIERGKLAKDIVTEALAARREGRASFARPATLGPGDLIALQATFGRGVMEIDRIATAWAAHEADMRRHDRDGQLAMTRARTEFMAGLPDRISNSLNPIQQEMLTMAERIDKQPRLDAIDTRQRDHTAALKANTLAIERLEKQPRRVTGIVLGDDRLWSTAFVAAWTLMVLVTAAIPVTVVEMAFPGIGMRVADRLVAGDAGFCRLVRYRFESNDCEVPRGRRVPIASGPTSATPQAEATGKDGTHPDTLSRVERGVPAHHR